MPYKFNPITGKMDYYEPAPADAGGAINPFAFRRTGRYYTSYNAFTFKAVTMSKNNLYAMPFIVATSQDFDRIGIYESTGVANGKARLGIYSDDGDVYPSSLQLQSAELDCSTSGLKEDIISISLDAGLYWLVINSTADANISVNGADYNDDYPTQYYYIMGLDSSSIQTQPYLYYMVAHAYGTLPNSFPAGASYINTADVPSIYLRKA